MRHCCAILAIFSVILFSCDSNREPAYQKAYDEVMEIHDIVMPKMSDINKAKKQLRKLKTEENNSIIDDQIQKLDEADEAMMSWMADFDKPNFENLQDNLNYLEKEKEKISGVSDQMLSVIAESKDLISIYQ